MVLGFQCWKIQLLKHLLPWSFLYDLFVKFFTVILDLLVDWETSSIMLRTLSLVDSCVVSFLEEDAFLELFWPFFNDAPLVDPFACFLDEGALLEPVAWCLDNCVCVEGPGVFFGIGNGLLFFAAFPKILEESLKGDAGSSSSFVK